MKILSIFVAFSENVNFILYNKFIFSENVTKIGKKSSNFLDPVRLLQIFVAFSECLNFKLNFITDERYGECYWHGFHHDCWYDFLIGRHSMGQKHEAEISGPVCLSNVMFASLPLKVVAEKRTVSNSFLVTGFICRF